MQITNNETTTVSTSSKITEVWNKDKLNSFSPKYIVENIRKFTFNDKFLVKTVPWTNNDQIPLHPKANILNYLLKLNLLPKTKFFGWKLSTARIPTRDNLRKIDMKINGECPFCASQLEDIDHLFMKCSFFFFSETTKRNIIRTTTIQGPYISCL